MHITVLSSALLWQRSYINAPLGSWLPETLGPTLAKILPPQLVLSNLDDSLSYSYGGMGSFSVCQL